MSNSPLVDYVHLSPNYSARNSEVCVITPHHAAGVVSVEILGRIFEPRSRQASSTYGIGYDGRKALFVDEKYKPWTSNSSANDKRAITIEVSNSQVGGNWPVSDVVFNSLIDLCVDICKRHSKKKLLFLGNKATTLSYIPKQDEMLLTMHKWFFSTACPGPYLESKFPELAKEVTKQLNEKEEEFLDMTEVELQKYVDARIEAKLNGLNTKPDDWAEKEVEEAKSFKITDGSRPKGYATRQEVMIMIAREHNSLTSLIAEEVRKLFEKMLSFATK